MRIGDSVLGPLPVNGSPYTVDADRRMTLTRPGLDFEGAITADGAVAALVTTGAGNPPALTILTRPESADLSGGYHWAEVLDRTDPVAIYTWGQLIFEDDGTLSRSMSLNLGNLPLYNSGGNGTYTQDPDGTFRVEASYAEVESTGAVAASGDLIVTAGDSATGSYARLKVMVRSDSAAPFEGTYHYVSLERLADGWRAATGTASSDGAGTLTLNGDTVVNTDGSVSRAAATQIPYERSSLGHQTETPNRLRGSVSPEGRFAVFSRTDADGRPNALYFLMR